MEIKQLKRENLNRNKKVLKNLKKKIRFLSQPLPYNNDLNKSNSQKKRNLFFFHKNNKININYFMNKK